MRTANPALNDRAFRFGQYSGHQLMTIDGAVNKSFILLLLVILTASYTWSLAFAANLTTVTGLMWLGLIGGFVVALVTIFKREWSTVTAPLYALLEGLALGGISAFFEISYPGIVIQAVALTFGTLFALLFVYKARLIKVTQNFRLGLFAATGAIALVYIVSLIGSFFGWAIPYIHEAGPIGIGFSLIVVTIAALNLVLDFDFIEHAAGRAPKYMEWYASFGLMVTLIWLYIEILRLLSKMRER